VADGAQPDGTRQPCWNPALFQPRGGPLMLFYKVGPNPHEWWGMVKQSDDDGRTWSEATRLPDGLLGPIKNKPVQLAGGDILSPSSIEQGPQWNIYFERSIDNGKTWTATPHVERDEGVRAIQPSILIHSATRLQAIGRTRSARLFETWSDDAGKTWSKLALTDLPNCNSGTDALTLADGRHLLVYNHSAVEKVRYPLNVAVSRDGRNWSAGAVLEAEPPGQYSYPAVIQSSDGLVHVTYTWKRLRIKHAVLDPGKLANRPIVGGLWP
jgi:predicted neuraminidase